MDNFKTNQKVLLKNLGFDAFNNMQNDTLTSSDQHANLLLLAPTGSGKTVAFLLHALSKINTSDNVQILILAPTRELVLQIEAVVKKMKLPFKTNACYGGHPFSVERKNFSTPPTILIGTPGRIEDHIKRETFDTSDISHVIFDEFDKSLEFGFIKQMESIIKNVPNRKGHLLVSATNAIDIPDFLEISNIHTLNYSSDKKTALTQKQIITPVDEKAEKLIEVLKTFDTNNNTIVFCNHREACDRICDLLDDEKIEYAIFHGGLEQPQRELELLKFRNGSAQFLIATDIAARGIDIPDLDYVIHYQLPKQESTFTHRNGRTARMKATGTSILVRTETDFLPEYIAAEPKEFIASIKQTIQKPEWITIYISKGKKDKINKMDVVGFCLQFDFMKKDDLGLIEVKDYSVYVAIKRNKSKRLLTVAKTRKIKNKKVKIEIAR
ncbi:DEAD/DEAH box helicase [Flavicella marina]|uniref:DEAD/DEAH box helicase n=1 Tax=Flavicella marina TaxID=1475951 RepID=UPI0012643E4A|nr:DEAD/DEAH box helicase [Flavicella marina]